VSERTPMFIRSIPLSKALHQDTLLALRMNDEPLPPLHGAPMRVITPGWMGESCMKWLTDLTVQEDEAQGYYFGKPVGFEDVRAMLKNPGTGGAAKD